MSDTYGQKIAGAIRAIRQMHSDSSRLLQDCDGTIGKGRKSIFPTIVTRGMSTTIDGDPWMAEGVYRYYRDTDAAIVDGVTVAFIDKSQPELLAEPLLIAGQIKYDTKDDDTIEEIDAWDLWYAYLDRNIQRKEGTVLVTHPSQTKQRVKWCKVAAIPLYSVINMKVVEDLMQQIRDFKVVETEAT